MKNHVKITYILGCPKSFFRFLSEIDFILYHFTNLRMIDFVVTE